MSKVRTYYSATFTLDMRLDTDSADEAMVVVGDFVEHLSAYTEAPKHGPYRVDVRSVTLVRLTDYSAPATEPTGEQPSAPACKFCRDGNVASHAEHQGGVW